ncbi:quinoprotein dehydrogenase-associated putative ABC transporter substrate-binding protein [Ramlibacter sp. MMS24-I3-19]|uniref:quinoprotein dehydrogenase-associated putative ABC transporter substrate-binding protein n=1 Tax=Ramlibacter sp. MMS24-I3-19 TaxID=3416606 RepID=UPI003CFF81E6
MTRAALLASLLAVLAAPVHADTAPPDVLRVCADPDDLPYSSADGTGFENRLARLLAVDLGTDLQYAWLPDRRGFVRKTLGAGLCDVVLGVPVGDARLQTTQPYYRSSYVWVQRADAGDPPAGFDDPRLARMRVGVQLIGNDMAASPPGFALARHVPQARVTGFPVPGATPAAQRIVDALVAGELDGALVWGPQAGFFAQRASVPMRLVRLAAPADLPPGQTFEFDIAVGVRRGDDGLRLRVQDALHRRQADIDRLLAEYGVPRTEARP